MASPEDFPALPDWLTGGGDVPLPEASFGLADLEAPSFDEPPPMPSDEWPAPEFGAADALAALPPNLDDTLPDFAELARPAPPPDFFAPPAKAAPSLTDTPPPAKVAALPPVTVPAAEDKWQSHAITVTPTLEADDTLIAYRITVRAPADRGYNDCKVTFPLPPGVKQVHASRKPLARKGWLTWLLGPLAPGEAIPLSVKVLRSPGTEGLLGQPKSFEVSHVAAPAAARIEFDANGPPLLLPGEEFRLKVVLANAGDEPAAHVRLRVKDGLGAATEEWTFGTVAAGGRATAEFDLVAGSAGRGEWEITALSDGNAPAVYTWTTDVVAPAVSVALVHPPAVRVDGEFDLTLDVANATPVPARGLSLVFEVPEEFAFVSAVGGRFDGSRSRVTWPAGDFGVGASKAFTVRLRGFAAGLARLRAEAFAGRASLGSTVGNVFCEVDDRAQASSLDKLLTALNDTVADDVDFGHTGHAAQAEGERHLVFELAGTGYAIPIGNVREVIRPPAIAPVPYAPDWLLGLANVRGDMVSVVDLARFLGMDDSAPLRRGLLVVQTADGSNVVGLLVDEIAGIRRVPGGRIDAAEELGDNPVAPFLAGVAELQGRLLPLLDIERLLTGAELNVFEMA